METARRSTCSGTDDLLVYRARCCNPIRGEEIVGYVTRGKGVAVTAKLFQRAKPDVRTGAPLAVEWGPRSRVSPARRPVYPVKLVVICDDRPGIVTQISAVISGEDANIRHIEAKTADSKATIDVTFETRDVNHLNRIITGIRRVTGVHDVERVQKLSG